MHPSRGRGRWVMVAMERHEEGVVVETWDIDRGLRVEDV